jgi:iron complex outermembrane receptor protein
LKKIVFCCFVLFTTLIPIVYGQEPDKTPAQKIDTVFIKSARVTSPVQKLPAAVSVYQTKASDATRQQLSLQEYTQQTPGLFTQNATNFAQDLRISMRGFGSRAAFGIRGIKLIVDGIPETTPDGQGQ